MSLSFLPYLIANDQPVIWNARTRSLIEQGVAGTNFWQPNSIEVCCPQIEQAEGFDAPIEDAWWWDADVPASSEFAGAAFDMRYTTLSKGWDQNGIAPRNIVARVILYALTERGLGFGMEAVTRQLGVETNRGASCGVFEGQLWRTCDESTRRRFCHGKVIDCAPLSTESFDSFWVNTNHGGVCPVASVLDLSIGIEDGCLFGPAETAPFTPIGDMAMCNPAAIHPTACCADISALLGGLQVSCVPIPPEYLCDDGPLILSSVDVCDPWCPRLWIRRFAYRVTGLTDTLGYIPSFDLTNPGGDPIIGAAMNWYPSSLFDDGGISELDDRLGAIGSCVAPTFGARFPYLPPLTSLGYDGRCDRTSVDCGGLLPYSPQDLYSSSRSPVKTTLDGTQDWTVLIDLPIDPIDQIAPTHMFTPTVTSCHIS